MEFRHGSLPRTRSTTQIDTTEQLLDVFKAAALSVTKLYKTSALAQSKARTDGYQDCLDDIIVYLNRENIGLVEGEGAKIRRWAAERLDGREPIQQPLDSEDETDKADRASSPEVAKPSTAGPTTPHSELPARTNPAAPIPLPVVEYVSPPTLDTFTFQSAHSYPNIANLDLSDTRSLDLLPITLPNYPSHHTLSSKSMRQRHSGSSGRMNGKSAGSIGRGSNLKRKLNIAEIFDLGSLARENMAGNSKRSRLT